MGTHSPPYLQNRLIDVCDFTKLVRDEQLMVPYKCCCFWPDLPKDVSRAGLFGHEIRPGVDPGWFKIRLKRGPSLKNFFRPVGHSNKPNAKQESKSMTEEVTEVHSFRSSVVNFSHFRLLL